MSRIKDPSVKQKKPRANVCQLIFEIIWYSLCGLVGLWGLTYIVLGTIIIYLPITVEENKHPLEKMDDKILELFKLRVLPWGLIILAIAAVAAAVVLILFSNKVDRDYEKNVRRAQRLAQLEAEEAREEQLEAFNKEEAVDAEVQPVAEQAPVQEEQPAEEAPVEEAPAEEVPQEEPKEN